MPLCYQVERNCFFCNHARIKYSWTAVLRRKQEAATGTSLLRSQITSNYFVFPLSLTESLTLSGGEMQELSLAKMSLNFRTIISAWTILRKSYCCFISTLKHTCNIFSTTATTQREKNLMRKLSFFISMKRLTGFKNKKVKSYL